MLPNSFKSALIPFFADIPLRAGYAGELRYGLLNLVHKLDAARLPLMAERYAQLAEKPGAELQRPLPRVRLQVDPVNTARTTARLGLDRSRPIAVFCPGRGVRSGQALAGAAFRRARARVGGARLRRLADRLGQGRANWARKSARSRTARALNLCGKTDLAAAIDLISAPSWW